jgi:hypothetical protein
LAGEPAFTAVAPPDAATGAGATAFGPPAGAALAAFPAAPGAEVVAQADRAAATSAVAATRKESFIQSLLVVPAPRPASASSREAPDFR